MSEANRYQALIDATILQLEDMQQRGLRYIPIASQAASDEAQGTLSQAGPASQPGMDSTVTQLPVAKETPAQKGSETQATTVFPEEAPTVSTPAAPPLSSAAKSEAITELRERALACTKCPNLAESRRNVVFGVGNINASLMFVGEAPGADEDRQGEPFVGRAGELLTKIIQTMGLNRDDVYIANILKCRPDTPGRSAGNRKPTGEEMQTCIPYLHAQIDLIQPTVLVALGATALEGLLGKTAGITRLRGHWHTYRGIPLMPTYHPAFLLRNQAIAEKRKVWEDMLLVMERMELPISEKQRNYFLKSRA